MKIIKLHNRNLIAIDQWYNVLAMDSTGHFNRISTIDLFWILKDDRNYETKEDQ